MSDVPECAACYCEGETACDGLYRKEKPCGWKEPCRKLRDFLRLTGLAKEKVFDGMGLGDLEKLAQVVADAQAASGTGEALSNAIVRLEDLKDRARPKGARAYGENVWRLHRHFEQQLADRFGERRMANRLHTDDAVQVVFKPGLFFPVDRTSNSERVTWYCKTGHGPDILIATILMRPALDAIHMGVGVDLRTMERHFADVTLRKLNPSEEGTWRQVRCWFNGLGYEGIGIAVGCLKVLVDQRVYPLPEVGQDDV
jgi:hypothetical protein